MDSSKTVDDLVRGYREAGRLDMVQKLEEFHADIQHGLALLFIIRIAEDSGKALGARNFSQTFHDDQEV